MQNRTKAGIGGIVLVSASFLAYLHQWEGQKFTPYLDVGSVWTVCAGIIGPKVIPGKSYSRAECDELETEEIEKHARGLQACVTGPLNQDRWDGLLLFAYNVGVAGACNSTAVKKINEGDIQGGCEALNKWVKVKGNMVRGLVNRRAFEYELCIKEER